MADMEAAIRAIKIDGLVWGEKFEVKDVAFGIQKLMIQFVCEDEKVSLDDVEEQMQSIPNPHKLDAEDPDERLMVQSVDQREYGGGTADEARRRPTSLTSPAPPHPPFYFPHSLDEQARLESAAVGVNGLCNSERQTKEGRRNERRERKGRSFSRAPEAPTGMSGTAAFDPATAAGTRRGKGLRAE